jgi:hypothetical protein
LGVMKAVRKKPFYWLSLGLWTAFHQLPSDRSWEASKALGNSQEIHKEGES